MSTATARNAQEDFLHACELYRLLLVLSLE